MLVWYAGMSVAAPPQAQHPLVTTNTHSLLCVSTAANLKTVTCNTDCNNGHQTLIEQASQFALWCMKNAPLILGGDLRNLLFENILESTQNDLTVRIQNDITRFFPNIVVKQLEFNNQEDRNTINFILTYQIENFGTEDLINIELQ